MTRRKLSLLHTSYYLTSLIVVLSSTFTESSALHLFSSSSSSSTLHENQVEPNTLKTRIVYDPTLANLWGVLFFVIGDHCPPGPLGKKCREEKDARAAAVNASKNAANHVSQDSQMDSNSSPSSNSVSSSSYDYDSSLNGESTSSNSSTSSNNSFFSTRKGHLMMITFASLACSVAMAAVFVGNNRLALTRDVVDRHNHPLFASLQKRISLFSCMTDRIGGSSLLCKSEAKSQTISSKHEMDHTYNDDDGFFASSGNYYQV